MIVMTVLAVPVIVALVIAIAMPILEHVWNSPNA